MAPALPGPDLTESIARETGITLDATSVRPIGGGSIHASWTLADRSGESWFLKTASADRSWLLAAESNGLAAIRATGRVRTPRFAGNGVSAGTAWLLLEHLDFSARTNDAAAGLGQALATLHACHGEHFGWCKDNAIGLSKQINTFDADWSAFFRDRRLRYQFELAANGGYVLARGDLLLDCVGDILANHAPAPSLLHGDLWGGNWGATTDGEPVIFDPAVYFGDREADIAMTRLFGGFPDAFYVAYRDTSPWPDGHRTRCELYNLYHVVNHLNLFGGGYLGQAVASIDLLLAECGH